MDDSGDCKRPSFDGPVNNNDGSKRFKKAEVESFPSVSGGNKSKPCANFFSISGCHFGDDCNYLHYVPGGIEAVNQMLGRTDPLLTQIHGFPSPSFVKRTMCKNYDTPKGCKFSDKCFFAHGEQELRRPPGPSFDDSRVITVNASYVGAIIGRKGENLKHITSLSGAKIYIQDHESDPNFNNVELEGSREQIQEATAMVNESIRQANFKTKLCDNFTEGACSFGDRCYFAHGEEELQKSGP